MKHLLIDARKEIMRLRHDCEILAGQVHVINVFASLLGFKPGGAQTMSVDVAYQLLNAIDDLQEKENRKDKRTPKEG